MPTELRPNPGPINPDRLDDLFARAAVEVDEGRLPSCQVAVGLDGKILAQQTFGDATDDTRYVVFSVTKGLIAGLCWQLIGEGRLDPAAPVTEYFEEFGETGKSAITIEQVMTHTGGFPFAPMGPDVWASREARVERMAAWRLTFEPGSMFTYHATAGHWVLAEVIDRITGADYRQLVTDRIAAPLGLSLRLGVATEDQGDIATIETRGEPATAEEFEAAIGLPGIDTGEVTDAALVSFNHPSAREVGVPGGGAVATAADLALYYQALLHNTGDLWDADVLADGTGHVRCTFPDPLLGFPANRTLGIILNGDDGKGAMRGFGHTTSPRSFGHNGAAGQLAWADPETGLSLGFVTNGIDVHLLRQSRRGVALSSRAAKLLTS